MKISKYGVVFELVGKDQSEALRSIRNLKYIRETMFYTDRINKKQHAEWFSKTMNAHNFYFLILDDNDQYAGVINIKEIDYKKSQGELGIFFKKAHWKTGLPFISGLLLLDVAMKILGLKNLLIHILAKNDKSNSFSQNIGFDYLNQTGTEVTYKFNLDKHETNTNKIRSLLEKKYGSNFNVEIEKKAQYTEQESKLIACCQEDIAAIQYI